jgi:RNA polymerase sigma factor (sigma-70 family)
LQATAADKRTFRALRQGDYEAFDHLFHSHGRRVHSFLYRMCWDEAQAESLTQETFMLLWKGVMLVDREAALIQVLLRLAKNIYLEHQGIHTMDTHAPFDGGDGAELVGAGREDAAMSARAMPVDADDEERPSGVFAAGKGTAGDSGAVSAVSASVKDGESARRNDATANSGRLSRQERAQREQAIRSALLRLDHLPRMVMVLSLYQGLHCSEIAGIIEKSTDEVKRMASAGERRLRDLLGGQIA